ncbi:MAG: AMP nucleosidase [Granulosicoccus sp.]|nr:AMP nucleosidase [Granulosicoccus sp.]
MKETLITPDPCPSIHFDNGKDAVDYLIRLYQTSTGFLTGAFSDFLDGTLPPGKHRAYYPLIRFVNKTYARMDSRLSYGHVNQPGVYTTTVTQPDLFQDYLTLQLDLLIRNHGESVEIGYSDVPIPLHFALESGSTLAVNRPQQITASLRDTFDVPDIAHVNDDIVNGTHDISNDAQLPLSAFTAQRVDYSLHRLQHYTATSPEHVQNFVLFTNYQFYVDEFCTLARDLMRNRDPRYETFVEPGNLITRHGESEPGSGVAPQRLPQMPSYHLTAGKNKGITLVNIGVGPSNAKTITDHIAVLRPHAWLMLGHCAGLRNSQELGDYVLAHAYVREDKVLDADIPVWVPIPALAEIQQALEGAVAEVTGLDGFELKRIMRTGTVASIDNRNWELQDESEPVRRLSQSRAIALDMESATIAANGFRLRVPYGTLLCVSDKPLQGELKLPGMASDFYQKQVSQHLQIGMLALSKLSEMKAERLHSRKLRSFFETAFQ